MAGDGFDRIVVADNGAGAADEQVESLNRAPHYRICDENTDRQRHGLGLLLVRQIMAVHGGEMQIRRGETGGFEVDLKLPVSPDAG